MHLFYKYHRDVNIEIIVHDDKIYYVKDGRGGKPIKEWPITKFFTIYNSGDVENANLLYSAYYQDQFDKYGNIPKSKGGMRNGSLYKLVNTDKGSDSNEFLTSVQKRIENRFGLLNKIKEKGYLKGYGTPIVGLNKSNNQLMLLGGHHRASILYSLGYKVIPEILVFHSKYHFKIYNLLKKITKG